MPGGREGGHVHADLANQVLGRPDAEAGDAVELGDLPLVRLAQDGDPLVQHRHLGGELVDVVQHHLQDEGVAGGEERAVQGLPQLGDLPPHPGPRPLHEGFGARASALP